jgi:LysM repeat protein/ABC-type branched-subunit amino acid transport system substrate-binding protein
MNKLTISFLFLFIIFSCTLQAQNYTGIKKSDKIETLDGQRFYIHKVKKGQTAYSISKAYGISLDLLYKYNPGAEQGLQLDQELKIAVAAPKPKPVTLPESPKDSISADGRFIFHHVQRGETLYRIMKNYNVNQDVLLQYNPGLSANLHPGDLIKIPTPEQQVSEKAMALYADLTEYKVKKKDTYYRLQKKYGVSQQQLEQLNPALKESGLQKGMIILMPAGLKKLDTIPAYVELTPDTLDITPDSLFQDTAFVALLQCDSMSARTDTFRIAIMMPFWEEDEAGIRTSNPYYAKEAAEYRSFRFIQFYEGFLMALDSMQKQGFNAEVYVYDTKNDTAVVRSITQKPEFSQLDLVIGPLFSRNLEIVLDAVRNGNTKVVAPFSREMSLIRDNPNLFKVAPSNADEVRNACSWIADSLPDARILIIHSGLARDKRLLNLVENEIQLKAGQGIDTNKVFVFDYNKDGIERMAKKLSKDEHNVVVNLANNEAHVSNLLRTLNTYTKDYEINLMGSESHWKRYKTLEIKYLVNLHLTLCSDYYINGEDSIVQHFEQKFINKYQTLPNKFAITGFDIAWYFMNALYYYGPSFESCLNKLKVYNMHTDFRFKKYEQGAWENSYLNIYQYDNYQLVPKRNR